MTTQELIERLEKMPPNATVKIIQEDITGERLFDLNTIESLQRVLVTTSGMETIDTVIIGI